MRKMNVSAYFVRRLLSTFLVASMAATPALQAQTQTAPAAGTSVTVRLLDAVNSANDAAGKQYRASVSSAVHAGNGVMIPQGAVAAVRLDNGGNGSGWTTQLVSVTIDGQPVAVASSSASVTSAAQTAAQAKMKALNGMNSILGAGHHVNAPADIAAVASGQRVILPMGTTLHFVLSQPLAPSPALSAGQPIVASASPAPSPASGPAATSGAGGLTAMEMCFSKLPPFPSDPSYNKQYLSAAFELPVDWRGELAPAFVDYLKATYQVRLEATCVSFWSTSEARTRQKQLADDRDRIKLKMVNTGWRLGQPPLAQGQSGFDPLAQGPGGLDLSQHRLTTYFCSLMGPDGTDYVSPVFQADWDAANVDRAFDVYLRDHYVHDLSLEDKSTRCSAQSPAMQSMMNKQAMVSSAGNGKVVAVDFTDTPVQVAAGNAAATQMAAAAAAAPKLGLGEYYVLCTSDPSAPVIYFSDVFVGKTDRTDIRGVSFRNIENTFLVFLQHKYSFKGPASCTGGYSESAPAQGRKQQLEDQYKKANTQIVETGWKNAP
jgi:hypothetical protein